MTLPVKPVKIIVRLKIKQGEIMTNEKALNLLKSKDYGRTREDRITVLSRVITAVNAEQILINHATETALILAKLKNNELSDIERNIIKTIEGDMA